MPGTPALHCPPVAPRPAPRPAAAGIRLLAVLLGLLAAVPGPAAAREHAVREGRVALSFLPGALRSAGLEIVGAARTVPDDPASVTGLEPPVLTFALEREGVSFRATGGRLEDPGTDGGPVLRAIGGLTLQARDPRTGAPRPPAQLYDFRVEPDPDRDGAARIVAPGAAVPVPLEVRNARIGLDPLRNAMVISAGDLVIAPDWAAALGAPDLAGTLIGGFDLRLTAREPLDAPGPPPAPEGGLRGAPILDVELFEVYGLTALGREGAYPNGEVGLSAATTSCNAGEVAVPWYMGSFNLLLPDHPFIGLSLFRESADGTLEMIGTNWIKHGFFTVDGIDCILAPSDTCYPGGGTTLGVGCADTYGVNNNGSRVYLGPREEVNPWTGVWNPYGSFFDATPVDTLRNYWGNETSETAHRLVVQDSDLADSTLVYKYEGVYYVKDDVDLSNNIGWEQVKIAWNPDSLRYIFTDATPGNERDIDGPVIASWGDEQAELQVAPDDGTVWLASRITSLGGGQWHYEYAVYNRTSARGLRSFSVPVGSANVTNIGFHDVDADPLTDWTVTLQSGSISWETAEYDIDPNANALDYQLMFNFRFDADVAPVPANALSDLYRPGSGTSLLMPTRAPGVGTSAPPAAGAADGFALLSAEPNPFREATRVAFSLDRARRARLSVVDVTGRTVRVLLDGPAPAGRSLLTWDGRDAGGKRSAAGIYFFRLESGADSRTLKGLLLR